MLGNGDNVFLRPPWVNCTNFQNPNISSSLQFMYDVVIVSHSLIDDYGIQITQIPRNTKTPFSCTLFSGSDL